MKGSNEEQNEIAKLSKFYDNKNAKTNCPDCESLNTYYYKNVLICSDCGYKMRVDRKAILKALKVAGLISVVVIIGLSLINI